MPIESLGWFVLGAGAALTINAVIMLGRVIFLRIKTRKFRAMINQLQDVSKTLSYGIEYLDGNLSEHLKPQISELTFRDRYGALNTVKIIVDPRLDQGLPIQEGDNRISNEPRREFVFSVRAVEEMRANGIEPDEAVTRILKASGRML